MKSLRRSVCWLLVVGFCAALVGVLLAQEERRVTVTGTAFVVNADGYLLTCAHVVRDAVKVEVAVGEKTYNASVLGVDEKRDVALLLIKAKGLSALPLGNSNAVKVGEEVRAFGFPLASVLGDSVKVTRGTVSGIETESAQRVFQIDAPVNAGNSGGPLVNEKGEVVGVVNAKLAGTLVSNVAFAVPINYAKGLLRDEGVEYKAEGAPGKLDGPALVERVSPAVALVTVARKSSSTLSPTSPRPPERIKPTDGAVMVYVPEGEFLMGSNDGLDDKSPPRRVYLDGYWIYKYEVTVAQYGKFCQATGRQEPFPPPWGWQNNHPVVNVSWHDAAAYCQWAGVRLPTEAEWEKAARGTDGRRYPWGNEWDSSRCQCSKRAFGDAGSTVPVGSFPQGASPYGVQDMAGNVWEWCADWYDENYYRSAPNRNPTGPSSGNRRVLRGGS